MDYGMFEEALVDFFCRQHHNVAVARSRAAAIIRIAQGCDEEIVGGDRGLVLDCTPPEIVPLIDECDVAIQTLDRYLAEGRQPKKKPLTIDFNDPALTGGKWLQPIRDAAEKIRRAALNQARKPKTK